MKRSSLIFALGGGLIGALLLRKQPLINIVHVHFDTPRPIDIPAPVVHVTIPPPTVVDVGPKIDNQEVDYPKERYINLDRIENEPEAEEFLLELIGLVQPNMGADRARTLREGIGLMRVFFAQWARELYKLPAAHGKD